MNFQNVKTPATTRTGGGTGAAADVKRAVELTMYKEAPSGEVSVEEFEKYALDRLRGVGLTIANISAVTPTAPITVLQFLSFSVGLHQHQHRA
jgi:hypothetical protein